MRKHRRQPPYKGGRNTLGAGLIKDIEICIQREADRHGVSRSWVIATILAHFFGINEQPSYRPEARSHKIKLVR